jgi:hypothetical protein
MCGDLACLALAQNRLAGSVLVRAGGLKVLAAVGFSLVLLLSSGDTGLMNLGLLAAVVVGGPAAAAGAFDLFAGRETLRAQRSGYVMGMVSAALGGLAFGLFGVWSVLRQEPIPGDRLAGVAVAVVGAASHVALAVLLLRLLRAPASST